MASYAFIQKDAQGVETSRFCATDASAPLRLHDGTIKPPSAIVVGDKIRTGGFTMVVAAIVRT